MQWGVNLSLFLHRNKTSRRRFLFYVGGQIKIGAIRQPEKLFSAERIIKFKIYRSFGVMGSVFRLHLKFVDAVFA